MTKNITKGQITIFVELTAYGSLNLVSAPLKLHKDSFNIITLKCAVPQSDTAIDSPVCKVFATSIDSGGNVIKSSNPYPLYINKSESYVKNGIKYSVFSCPMPKEFCETVGELKLTFNYFNTVEDIVTKATKATSIITSGTYVTRVDGVGANMDGVVIADNDATAVEVHKHTDRLDDEVLQVVKRGTATLPHYMQPYHKDGYKRANCEYIEKHAVPVKCSKTSETVNSTGKVRVVDITEYDDTAENESDKNMVYQTETFECEYGVFLRTVKFNRDTTGKYETCTSAGAPYYWVPANKDYWQEQLNEQAQTVAELTEKENDRDHFKGMFTDETGLPPYDETDPKGATDNDYAYVIKDGKIWIVDAAKHKWTATVNDYPSDTSMIDRDNTAPRMNGEACAGVGVKVSASDHVHPHDTDRAPQSALDETNRSAATLKNYVEEYESKTDEEVAKIQAENTLQNTELTAHGGRLTELETYTQNNTEIIETMQDTDARHSEDIATLDNAKLAKSDINLPLQKASDSASYMVTETGAIIEKQVTYNPSTKQEITAEHMVVPVTNNAARLILVQEQTALQELVDWKNRTQGETRNYPADLSGVPTGVPASDPSVQSFLNDTFHTVSGKTDAPLDQTQLIDDEDGTIYRYYTFETQWKLTKGSPATKATQESLGVGKGSTQKYYNFYEVDGTSTPNGLDELDLQVQNSITANEANAAAIAAEESARLAALNALQAEVTENTNTIPNKADKTVTVAGKSLESNVTLDELTLQKNGTTIETYNGDGSKTVNIAVPTKTSDLTNDGDGSNAYATVNRIPTNYISTAGGQTINGVLSVGEPVTDSNVATKGYVDAELIAKADETAMQSALASKAPIDSPNFNGGLGVDGDLSCKKLTASGIVTGANVAADNNTQILARTQMQFTESVSGTKHYIGKDVGALTISGGTHVFTNCKGTLTYSGSSAKVYITNSPGLTPPTRTSTNWRNIFVDGVAEFEAFNSNLIIQPNETEGFSLTSSFISGDKSEILCSESNVGISWHIGESTSVQSIVGHTGFARINFTSQNKTISWNTTGTYTFELQSIILRRTM